MTQPRIINGVAVCPGLALGPVHVVRASRDMAPSWSLRQADVETEVARLGQALREAGEEMGRRQRVAAAQAGEKDAQIFAVHRMILQDPAALGQVEATIRRERINAEAAVQGMIDRLVSALDKLEGNSVRGYGADLADPWYSVLEALALRERAQMEIMDRAVVVAATALTPHVVTYFERRRVLAVIAETGGRFSHAAVLARAFGVPCVVGLPELISRLVPDMLVAVDGSRGVVQLEPGPEQVRQFEEQRLRLEDRRQALKEEASLPAVTTDGATLGVQVNIESLRDLEFLDTSHSDGLGLVRTEFLYMERPQFPSEEEQYGLYKRLVDHMGALPVTLRTLDIGGDKRLPYFKTPEEINPALGWRGLRVSLEWQDLLRVQLRAALRAGFGHDLRILLPMVSSLEEIQQARVIFDGVRATLVAQGLPVPEDVPVGMMVEVPSVLFCLDALARHVDFLSVGTNDLVQYLLAVDRDNPWVARLYEPYHPAVMHALARVAEVARAAGKPVSVCGDIADDPAVALLLLGMGYDSVSVAPHFPPEIRYAVRRTSLREAQALVRQVLAQESVQGVRGLLSEFRDRLHGG